MVWLKKTTEIAFLTRLFYRTNCQGDNICGHEFSGEVSHLKTLFDNLSKMQLIYILLFILQRDTGEHEPWFWMGSYFVFKFSTYHLGWICILILYAIDTLWYFHTHLVGFPYTPLFALQVDKLHTLVSGNDPILMYPRPPQQGGVAGIGIKYIKENLKRRIP